jgi:MarC family integral membrane protein
VIPAHWSNVSAADQDLQRFRDDLDDDRSDWECGDFCRVDGALTRVERRRTALRAVLYATVILVVAVVAGQIILDAIGIRMHSLKVAGGIILFLFALKMLFGGLDKPGSPEAGRDLAVFPLAVPSIAGPGAMMAVIVLRITMFIRCRNKPRPASFSWQCC